MTAMDNDPLLQPLRIRHLVLRNRIMSTSHAATIDGGGNMTLERYQRYHEEKAKGGLALTMFGGSSMISPDTNWGGSQVDMSSDVIIPTLRRFSERIHRHGAAIGVQISHLGRRADPTVANWLPAIGPSRLREVRHRAIAREMDEHDIARVVADYGKAAKRAKEGGLDCLETLTGGHIIGQFFSPRTNFRTDRFGGSLENRARFGLMVHEEIRRQVGDDFIVGIRFVIDEEDPTGLNFQDCLDIARIFEREGQIDFFNCIFGRMDTQLALLTHNIPNMAQPIAPYLKPTSVFKAASRLPVFHAARIPDIATARWAIAEKHLDMVGMTRAHMADPQIVNKLMRGEEDRIRPCIGTSHCLYRLANCIHNAATGRETFLPQVVEKSDTPGRRIVVVGAGPAGLEAARVSAERGHHVVVFEAASKPGGQVLIAARASWRRDLIAIIDWRVAELARMGVQLRTNVYAEEADILAEKPDIVIIATGGIPDVESLKGGELCNSTWDVLTDPNAAKEDIIVYDGTGRHEAPSCALHLAETGHRVRFFTQDDSMSQEMEYQSRITYRKKFAENGVDLHIDYELVRVERSGNALKAVFKHVLTEQEFAFTGSQVIVERGTLPVDDLYRAMRVGSVNDGVTNVEALLKVRPQPDLPYRDGRHSVFRVGDAVSSRSLHAAIYDSFRLCVAF